MRTKASITKPLYSFLHADTEGFAALTELALDLRWSWDHSSDEMWQMLNPELWAATRSPWVVLQTVSRQHLQTIMKKKAFRSKIESLIQSKNEANTKPGWFQTAHPKAALNCVAYFSLEFMLSEALPIYSGGLGNVAGDQLKTASDLGVPVIGIGLLYQQGYFRQEIDINGEQQALYPYNDPGQLPISPLRQANGEWLRIKISLPGHSLWLRTWQVQVGRVKLYLLDSNDAANFPLHRGITGELYGGGTELRLKQEIVLGIGGWRLLNTLGIEPHVCHLNEGHAAFAILERACSYMNKTGENFEVALAVTRAGNLFTTHTAVTAGFDVFSPALINQFLGEYAKEQLNISVPKLLALGRINPSDNNEMFNMAYLAVRGCGAINGVSRLHCNVSRSIFEPLFNNWPAAEIPVGYITNGVHMPTWDSKEADEIWTETCGKDRWMGLSNTLETDIRAVSDERLWAMRTNANKALIEFSRLHIVNQLQSAGQNANAIANAKLLFDPEILTLGFARRFATYKRPNLLLHNPQRLLRLLTNPKHPVQLILSGKAHPADKQGQQLIKEWIHFIRQNNVKFPVVFLVDYDMHVSENLVQGVDVWINTPRRPWEASGTSGMKVLVNGGINLSVLDGWWAEAYNPQVGWALGDGLEHNDEDKWDAIEAEQLYNILEQEIVPEFYNRNGKGIPTQWVSRMRESMAQLTPQFSADRSVREYTEQHYLPAAIAYLTRAANKSAKGKQIVSQSKNLLQHWKSLSFGEMKLETNENQHEVTVQVYFNYLNYNNVCIELYANVFSTNEPQIINMKRGNLIQGTENAFYYNATFLSERFGTDYTIRAKPCIAGINVPLELPLILWQK